MNPQDTIDLAQQAVRTCLMIGAPILLITMALGLVTGIFQAMTNVQDQAVSFVPKMIGIAIAIGLLLPWSTEYLNDFATSSFGGPAIGIVGHAQPKRTPPPAESQPISFDNRIARVPVTRTDSTSMPTLKSQTNSMPTMRPRESFDFDSIPTRRSGPRRQAEDPKPIWELPQFRRKPTQNRKNLSG